MVPKLISPIPEWIPLDFLEALPDDMREEVLNQHFREQRPVQEELLDPVPSGISTNFLNAPSSRSEDLA
jgi:E3 ubiquitin-protein ligase HUWE1